MLTSLEGGATPAGGPGALKPSTYIRPFCASIQHDDPCLPLATVQQWVSVASNHLLPRDLPRTRSHATSNIVHQPTAKISNSITITKQRQQWQQQQQLQLLLLLQLRNWHLHEQHQGAASSDQLHFMHSLPNHE